MKGRPIQNKKKKIMVTITIDPDKKEKILERYETLSGGIDRIVKDWINKNIK